MHTHRVAHRHQEVHSQIVGSKHTLPATGEDIPSNRCKVKLSTGSDRSCQVVRLSMMPLSFPLNTRAHSLSTITRWSKIPQPCSQRQEGTSDQQPRVMAPGPIQGEDR